MCYKTKLTKVPTLCFVWLSSVYFYFQETNSTSDCYINYRSCCKIYCCLQTETVLVLFCLCFNSLMCPFRNGCSFMRYSKCVLLLSPLCELASNCSMFIGPGGQFPQETGQSQDVVFPAERQNYCTSDSLLCNDASSKMNSIGNQVKKSCDKTVFVIF